MPGARELEGERHGEAAGMGGGDQLLRIGARPVGEAGLEAVARLLQHAALRGKGAGALLARALPGGGGGAADGGHVRRLLFSEAAEAYPGALPKETGREAGFTRSRCGAQKSRLLHGRAAE